MRFNSILVANRGEIACRIMQTAQFMGIKCVAVFVDADKDAPFVKMADEAIKLSSDYMDGSAIIEAAKQSGAEAIHPGYGFLSENAKFSEIVNKHGIKFIGPSAKIISMMGDKIEAKRVAKKYGLPVIEGSEGGVKSLSEARSICKEIGYPVLIKAAGGGGGKGMKVVQEEGKLESLFLTAKSEAKKFFNNDELYIEKYFKNPRHIEVQIMSGKNKTVQLGERDCSVQRRHQKLIEETPSPVITDDQRKNLLEKTVKMVEQINYEGAGTVEFIYENGKFYFLEMNTRVQVEHPVTEVQTGIDIVKEQLWIAYTGETALKQSDINPRGHTIECRINAENPSLNFQPSPGTISVCHQPSGFRTRVDGSVFQGCKVTPYYDSLIAKVICKGRNRTEAIQRTLRSLDEFVLEGITTTIDLHKKILKHKKFLNSDFDTNWLEKEKFF